VLRSIDAVATNAQSGDFDWEKLVVGHLAFGKSRD
jgi:hypothetical protein